MVAVAVSEAVAVVAVSGEVHCSLGEQKQQGAEGLRVVLREPL